MSGAALAAAGALSRTRRQTWGLIGVALVLYALLRFYFGPLPQDPAYHLLADTRVCGPIPRAGDVLTNLALLTAGIAGVALWRRARIEAEERLVYALLVASMVLTAVGSAYYHWAPSDARLVWDRLPLALTLMALLVLVMADRIDVAFACAAWWPFALLGVGSVLWWSASGDLLLYLIVRVGAGVLIVCLLLLRAGRHSGVGWLWAALALDVVMTVGERLDYPIFAATRGIASGHNVKHVLAGALLGCILVWLVRRRRYDPATAIL
jgi:hypothetical protein